jgi:hypothetical protein
LINIMNLIRRKIRNEGENKEETKQRRELEE